MPHPLTSPACPDCGAPLPPESPQALCPACLMRQALASRTIIHDGGKTPQLPPPSPEEIADRFPGHEILECLGRGGMGVVYKARQKSLNRLVAIKILAPERVGEEKFAERFTIEAEMLAKLSHPHIVTIHDFGETGGLFYLVMEFIDGVNLRDLLRDGKLAPEQALAIVPPVCDALQYAHEKGIVHRDIKPENLLLDRDGRIKIADFGIAKLIEPVAAVYDRRTSNDEESQRRSQSDATLNAGTLGYSAPEQTSDPQHVDQRADIYSLGVVLYEMLTGERPNKELVAPSRKVRIDVRIDEIVLRALEKTPELRYQTAGEFRTVLETMDSTKGSAAVPAATVEIPSIGTAGEASRETPSLTESQFSRTAIAGACWLAFIPLHFLFPLMILPDWRHNALIELLAMLQVLLFWTAPLGVTILGWIAVSQIRRSAGRLHGMWLAVFDGLLLPLLALDALLIGLPITAWKRMPWENPPQPELLFITIIVLSVLTAVWLDWLIIHRVWRAVNSNNPTAPQQTGSTDKPSRFSRKAIHVAACVFVALSFAVLFIKQWNERKREGVWVPARISDTIAHQYGDAQVRVVDVSQTGQVVVVSFVCEMFRPDHELRVQYGGPVLSYPNDLASSVNAKVKGLDCLVVPRAKIIDDNIGEVLAGTNVLSGRTMFRIGFVLPDSQTAAQVVKAVQEVHLGKPRGLGEGGGVLLLFSLRRDFGKDAAAKPVIEGLDATLWLRPKSTVSQSRFIRKTGGYQLGEGSIALTPSSDGKVTLDVTMVEGASRDTNTVPDFCKKEGWFVYIENPKRVWIFDGIRQLDLLTQGSREAAGPNIRAVCPTAVWDAVPESVRKFYQEPHSKETSGDTGKPQEPSLIKGVESAVLNASMMSNQQTKPGLTVFQFVCEIPANHILAFELIHRSAEGKATSINELSGFAISKPTGRTKSTYLWEIQDGAMLSSDMAGQERWRLFEGSQGGPDRFVTSPYWRKKDSISWQLVGNRAEIRNGDTKSYVIGNRHFVEPASEVCYELVVRCRKLPLGVTVQAGKFEVGTNWNALVNPPGRQMEHITFGPVVERVVMAYEENPAQACLDFGSGEFRSPPAAIAGRIQLSSDIRAPGDDRYDWFKSSGVDLIGIRAVDGSVSFKFMGQPPGYHVGNSTFDSESPGEVIKALQLPAWSPGTKPDMPDIRPQIINPDEGLSRKAHYIAFRTQDGDVGIMQILGTSQNPRGLKIRYKLVRNVATKEGASAKPSGFKPIPAEAARLLAELKGLQNSPAFAGRDITSPEVMKELQVELAKRTAAIEQLLSGTAAEPLVKQQKELLRQLAEHSKTNPADANYPSATTDPRQAVGCDDRGGGWTVVGKERRFKPRTGSEQTAASSAVKTLQFRWVAAQGDAESPADVFPDPNDPSGKQTLRVLREVVLDRADIEHAEVFKPRGRPPRGPGFLFRSRSEKAGLRHQNDDRTPTCDHVE